MCPSPRCNVPTLLLLLLRLVVATTSSSSPPPQHPDLVTSLPGYPSPLPTPWYSGYITYTFNQRTVHTHYVYVESSAKKRKDDTTTTNTNPIIFWSNGGPGASSLYGLFTEIGPLLLSDLSLQSPDYHKTGIPTPILNSEYSWNNIGDILLFDAPAPVGFSYCNDDIDGDGYSCGDWDDELAAENNYRALCGFYDKFQHLSSRELFLTGESYAGIYIPMLARLILERNDDDGAMEKTKKKKIPLKGFAVGDACVGTKSICGSDNMYGTYFRLLFLAGHGQLSWRTYATTMEACGGEEKLRRGFVMVQDEECKQALDKANNEVGGYFEYSLYDECTYRNGLLGRGRRLGSSLLGAAEVDNEMATTTTSVSGALNDYPCGGGLVMEEYLKISKVREALHVPVNAAFFDGDNGNGFNYTPTEPDLSSFYLDVANGTKYKTPLRMLVYNGDTDPSITQFIAQNWTESLNLTEVEYWRPWTIDGCRRVGGHVTRYEGGLDFLTVKGAGHMVPTYKPAAALRFLKCWMEGEEYPRYVKDCKGPPSLSLFGNGEDVTVRVH